MIHALTREGIVALESEFKYIDGAVFLFRTEEDLRSLSSCPLFELSLMRLIMDIIYPNPRRFSVVSCKEVEVENTNIWLVNL